MLQKENNSNMTKKSAITTLLAGTATSFASFGLAGTNTVHADEIKASDNAVNQGQTKKDTVKENVKNKSQTYTIKKGDTLYNISQKTGISLQKLFDYNKLNANSVLQIGQKINLTDEKAENQDANKDNKEELVKVKQTITKEKIDENGNKTTTQEVKYVLVPKSEANKTYTNTEYHTVNKEDNSGQTQSQQKQQSNNGQSQQSNDGQQNNNGQVQQTQSSSDKAQNIVNRAKQLASMNIPYVWGGTSLSGMDCSGLVKIVLGEQGINIGRVTTQQEQHVVKKSVSQAQPGDLLFWGNQGSTYHVAIYIGNNQYVEAPQPGQNVHIRTISPYFMPSFAGSIPGVNA